MCFVFSLFVCLVVNLSEWRYFHPCCCICLCWPSCFCVCVCVYVIGRVWIFVVNLGDWRQVPGWQWSHGQPEPGWLLGRRWFTAGILSETNTTSYSALIKHQKKGLRPQTFRSGKCFNPTTSKSRIYVLETFDRFNFIEVCRTINYTRFWVPQHCDLVENWPLSPIFIRFIANLEEKKHFVTFFIASL